MSVESTEVPVMSPAARSRKNGLGTAGLVLGVASLVAALSFVLLPLALLGGVLAVAVSVAALTRGRAGGTANPGQAWAGLICGILALAAVFVLSVRVGSFMAQNTSVFSSVDHCLARARDRSSVATCMAHFAKSLR